ncbi:hypothetical protein [Clostridium sp. DJ247]|uniref:hypothetical protein n=1 Tax=Clostridium sp. DJ247 TaxID=2726188 RepID=UPI0028BF2AA2|nr:hypothetical protein [Clostridium sp. DJ247]
MLSNIAKTGGSFLLPIAAMSNVAQGAATLAVLSITKDIKIKSIASAAGIISINIVNFKCIPLKKLHSSYHVIEDETGYKLTDALQVHLMRNISECKKFIQNYVDKVIVYKDHVEVIFNVVFDFLEKSNPLSIISNDKFCIFIRIKVI